MKILARLALLASFCLTPLAVQAQELELPGFPNLCGQKSIYMMQQLTMFRKKKRQSEVMNITTENLTDDDI